MNIKEILKENRGNLSDSSIKTYSSTLNNLYARVFPDDGDDIELEKFDDTEEFMKFLKHMTVDKRKTYYNALFVLTGNGIYKTQMMKDADLFNQQKLSQKKSDKESESWVTQDELKEIFKSTRDQANAMYKLKSLTPKQIQIIQNHLIICLVSGLYIPIRRLMDWSEMITGVHSESVGNYIKKNPLRFVFNTYKTAKFLGTQEVKIPIALKHILVKWMVLLKKYYPDNIYLLVDVKGEKLTSVKLNQRLNKIFGKKTGINILRHSNITEYYSGDMPPLKDMMEQANARGHSLMMDLGYIKK